MEGSKQGYGGYEVHEGPCAHREGQVVFLRPQRAELGGEQAWQHIQAALDEISAGGPVRCFLVQGGLGVHEVRHI